MNARQVAEQITSTCESLYALHLVTFYNTPHQLTAGERSRVSWHHVPGSGHEYPFGSLEQYLSWVRGGEFTCILFDNSLVRASYDCVGNNVVSHSLLYWPCPIRFHSPVGSLNDLCDGLQMCIDSPKAAAGVCDLTLRTPMRFDYDPETEREDHPLVHLHTQFEDTRLYVDSALSFPSFIKKMIRSFYFKEWLENTDLETIHDQAIDHEDGGFDPMPHCLQVCWC